MADHRIIDIQRVNVHHVTEVHHTYETQHVHHARPTEIEAQDHSVQPIPARLTPLREIALRVLLGSNYKPAMIEDRGQLVALPAPQRQLARR